MSKYSAPITAIGSLISFYALQGGLIDSLSVPITPTQNLNGYTKPWAGGAGENKYESFSGWKNNITFTPQSDGTVKITGTANITMWSSVDKTVDLPYNGIAAGDTVTIWSDLLLDCTPYNGNTSLGQKSSTDGNTVTFVIPANANKLRFNQGCKSTQATAGEVFDKIGHYCMVKGNSFSAWTPYENVCHLNGLTGLSAYVSPTSDIADATTYSVDWTAEAGTVYGGSYEAVSGELKTRPYIASYNGETLVGPWVSSMDEYAEGATPTTGAQVVDLGGTETAYQLTAQEVSLIVGQNYLWASNSANMSMTYRLWMKDRVTAATSIGKKTQELEFTPVLNGYSKVVINVTDKLFYESGDDTGTTLTLDCPWGTQVMADHILASIIGFQYQPYEAKRAVITPAAELGDGLTVSGIYGGIFDMVISDSSLHELDVSAPSQQEVEHEYGYVSKTDRRIERQFANVKSALSVQADQISAKVDREGGDPSSVSWKMDADNFKIAVDGSDVLVVDDNGLTVNGDGNFTGEVHAGNIKYGGSSGSFSGRGISGGSIGASKVDADINTQLANAQYAASVFAGSVRASWGKFGQLDASYFKYGNKVISLINYNSLDGSYKVLCTNQQ